MKHTQTELLGRMKEIKLLITRIGSASKAFPDKTPIQVMQERHQEISERIERMRTKLAQRDRSKKMFFPDDRNRPPKKPMKRKYFTTRKYMGDDIYSWAVFRKGSNSPIVSGCSQTEAKWRADELEKEERKKKGESLEG